MKTITDYINEKLTLNNQSKVGNYPPVLKHISEILYIDDEVDEVDKELKKFVRNWIKKNNVTQIEAISTKQALNAISEGDESTYELLSSLVKIDEDETLDNIDYYEEAIHKFRNSKKLVDFDGYCDGGGYGYVKEVFSDKDVLICIIDWNYIFIMKVK